MTTFLFFSFFFHTSQAFLSIAVVLSQSDVARTWECNKAPYEVAYGIEFAVICKWGTLQSRQQQYWCL